MSTIRRWLIGTGAGLVLWGGLNLAVPSLRESVLFQVELFWLLILLALFLVLRYREEKSFQQAGRDVKGASQSAPPQDAQPYQQTAEPVQTQQSPAPGVSGIVRVGRSRNT